MAFGLTVLPGSVRLQAQTPKPDSAPVEPLAPAVITTGGEFWNLSDAEKQKSHPLRMEITVYYYDPQWHLLWGESAGAGFYLPMRGRALQIGRAHV